MFKILSIGVLLYILYKLVFPPTGLKQPKRDNLNKSNEQDTIDIDYEEVD